MKTAAALAVRTAFAVTGLFAFCSASRAQVAPQTPPPDESAKPAAAAPDTVTLSPFTVNTDRDTGFAAASALAGGRLATDLRDTPTAYSVINRDFIDALNLTDLQAAQNW